MALSKPMTGSLLTKMSSVNNVPTKLTGMRIHKFHAYAIAPAQPEAESAVRGENVILFGAGNLGKHMAHQLLLKDVKGLTIIDRNVKSCKTLKDDVKARFPIAPVSYILDDIISPAPNSLQKALRIAGYLGPVDMIIDATNVTPEENNEDTLKPSSVAMNQFMLSCLNTVKPGGRFVTFKNSPGFPASLCKYQCITMTGMEDISPDQFVKMCMHRIEMSKFQQYSNEKLVFSFFAPRFHSR